MIERARPALKVAFMVYALVLFAATHKPGVDVNVVPGFRLDLFIHAAAFGLWTVLLGLTGWLGNAGRALGMLALLAVGVMYAIVDEATQAVPIFDRVFDVKDMMANVGGALLGAAVVSAFLRRLRGDEPDQP